MRTALIVFPEAPYPAIGGGPLRSASIVEALAGQFELTAIHFRLEGDPDPASLYPTPLLERSHNVTLPHHAKSFLPRLGRNLMRAIRGVPPLMDRFGKQESALLGIVGNRIYDLVWLEHFWLAPYGEVLRPHAKRLVLDLHNIDSAYYASLARSSPWLHKPLLHWFANRAGYFEAKLLAQFDLLLTTSAQDAARLRHSNVQVLPNTIPWHSAPSEPRTETMVFTGNFAYTPNQQGLDWFLNQVWPIVLRKKPNLRLRLVGKEIHYARSSAPNIDYVGPVEDAVVEIARSEVVIVPLQSGSGTRLKILEAFAACTPVVSTSIGAEGLEAIPGQHYKLADCPESFAQAVVELFDNREERSRLAEEGRRLYEARYTWQSARKILSELDL